MNLNLQLSPADFVNLSLTCRYLHWRIFTFCTCYVDYGGMEISDVPLSTTLLLRQIVLEPKCKFVLHTFKQIFSFLFKKRPISKDACRTFWQFANMPATWRSPSTTRWSAARHYSSTMKWPTSSSRISRSTVLNLITIIVSCFL